MLCRTCLCVERDHKGSSDRHNHQRLQTGVRRVISDYTTALVTGASGGIGAGIVAWLASRGIKVHAVARNGERLAELSAKTGCIPHVLDIRDTDALEQLAELQNMLMRLVGNLATVEFAVPRPDLQQPLRTPIGDTVPRMHQANNGTETSRTIDYWQPHTHQDRCRHPNLSQLQCTCNALAMHLQCTCNALAMHLQCTCNALAMRDPSGCFGQLGRWRKPASQVSCCDRGRDWH